MKGIDYGFGKISGKTIKDAGFDFVCRYLSTNPEKNLTLEEYNDFGDNDLKTVVVWETTEQRCLAGHGAGVQDATAANEILKKICEYDVKDIPIYFACDYDFSPYQCNNDIKAYLQGCVAVLGKERVGVYGGLCAVKYAFDNDVVSYGWQTYAWSHGQWDERAQLRQTNIYGPRIAGVDCDTDESFNDDFGQF